MKFQSNARLAETMAVFPEEARLIKYCRELGYGELILKVRNGLPVMIHKPREDVKLTIDT